MYQDRFEARLAKVRHRFAGSLASRVDDTIAAFSNGADETPEAAASVDQAYRRIHSICGIALTAGFPATAKVAGDAEALLLPPIRSGRSPSRQEGALVRQALQALRKAAEAELQIMYGRGG
jgi:chemotaxis protein histidine kinase CheA